MSDSFKLEHDHIELAIDPAPVLKDIVGQFFTIPKNIAERKAKKIKDLGSKFANQGAEHASDQISVLFDSNLFNTIIYELIFCDKAISVRKLLNMDGNNPGATEFMKLGLLQQLFPEEVDKYGSDAEFDIKINFSYKKLRELFKKEPFPGMDMTKNNFNQKASMLISIDVLGDHKQKTAL